jgi:hypothetical protein
VQLTDLTTGRDVLNVGRDNYTINVGTEERRILYEVLGSAAGSVGEIILREWAGIKLTNAVKVARAADARLAKSHGQRGDGSVPTRVAMRIFD